MPTNIHSEEHVFFKGPLLSRRTVLLGSSSLAISAWIQPRAFAARENRADLTIGLSAPSYYSGFCPFLNWWKQGAPIQMHLRDGGAIATHCLDNSGSFIERNGELCRPCAPEILAISRIFFSGPNNIQREFGCDFSGEPFTVLWDGVAEGHVDFLTAGGVQSAVGSNRIDFSMGQNPGNTSLTLRITDVENPPRNIKIVQSRYLQNLVRDETFNPDWLTEIRKFAILRVMDWQATNNSSISEFDQLAGLDYVSWCQPCDVSPQGVPVSKGSVHPSLLCKLANEARSCIHICLPHLATNEFVKAIAVYCRDNTKYQVTYEFSNECWNGGFTQFRDCVEKGGILWPNDVQRGYKYYGYRAAECMTIIREVYGDPARWRGALATQTVNFDVTLAILQGVDKWRHTRLNPADSLEVRDLFGSIYVTGYFGDVATCAKPEAVALSNPAVVKCKSHGLMTGETVKCFINFGMVQLDGQTLSVTRIDEDHFSISVDARDFDGYSSDSRNYFAPAAIFQLMEKSVDLHRNDSLLYPTKYVFFNEQLSKSLLTGQCEFGIRTKVSVAQLKSRFWPQQLRIARSRGLTLRQYEGGCHFVGDAYLSGFGGNPEYTDYMLHHGHCEELAEVYTAMYVGFRLIGGEFPSKYVADGAVSQYGSWAGVRFWPTVANGARSDTGNSIWMATTSTR